ncbi:MAG TPA: benzoyl-CoA-dihydrodiol lyase, partial [Gammaproteobacteria bacterium]|nr:benzoyl-CoA-dihydrodiol lyase [Gammaproteobacteria bacterium]
GANIRMLAGASHAHKVNFCKFTNETRNAIEDASAWSEKTFISVIQGTCAGGGYELVLATDYILMADDGSSSIALPEVPLLAVLPGTGGLTRITDKRKVRRDIADVFATLEEGVRGPKALAWGLIDQTAPPSELAGVIEHLVNQLEEQPDTAISRKGIVLKPLDRNSSDNTVSYSTVRVDKNRTGRTATLTISGPQSAPENSDALSASGAAVWALRCARELDDALLHLRFNEPDLGVLIFRTEGDSVTALQHDAFLNQHAEHWLVREIMLYWKRVLKRIDLTSRSLVALIDPGSCFVGLLAEIMFACDRTYMLIGQLGEEARLSPVVTLTASNFGPYPMSNDLTRLKTRFIGRPVAVTELRDLIGDPLPAQTCLDLGLVTFAFDELDWEDEIRIFLEERTAFSPDALIGLEANLRFPGPETMETKIFGRLSAWQNWIFQRGNAAGEQGALRRYGSGQKGTFSSERT